ncbi:NKG2-A/NKG2-B type II integral membrane protein [Lemmus lemmus]
MSNERVTYVELNVLKDSRNQKRQPRGTRSSISVTEQEITYLEFNFQNTSPEHPSVCRDCCCKDPEAKEQINSSLPRTERDNNFSSEHHCDPCPNEWMSYSHSCYYVSVEKKNWTDSLVSCKAKNSSLLYIDSKEEQEFLQSLSHFAWTSVFRESRDHLWVWKKDSTFKPKIREVSHVEQNCVVLSSSGLTAEKCTGLYTYLCKHKITN